MTCNIFMYYFVLNIFNTTHKMQLIMVIRNIRQYSYPISIFGQSVILSCTPRENGVRH